MSKKIEVFDIKYQLLNLANLTTIAVLILGTWNLSSSVSIAAREQASFLISQSSVIKASSDQKKTLYLNNDHTYSYNLIAQERGSLDGITIPVGATIVGKYVPADGGLRYVAEAVTYGRYSYKISATSETLADVKDPRDTSAGAIASDAGIGAAGGAVLGEVLSDEANVGEIIGGAAAGAAVGNVTADRVIVIEPDQSIALFDS